MNIKVTIINCRGQMGAATEEGGKADEQKLPNGDVKKSKKKHKENNTESTKDNVTGCCQVGNGFTCCKDTSLEQSSVSEEKKLKETIGVNEKNGVGKVSSWIGSWEQSDVLTAAAVVGAVATVAVAYSFYRRSG